MPTGGWDALGMDTGSGGSGGYNFALPSITGGGGGSGGGFDLGGVIGGVISGVTGSLTGGGSTQILGSSSAKSYLSSVLGLPSINWGRIAAFLLGLLLIAGGLYLIKPVQQVVNRTVKETARGATEVAAA